MTVKRKRLVKIIFKLIEIELMDLIEEHFFCIKPFSHLQWKKNCININKLHETNHIVKVNNLQVFQSLLGLKQLQNSLVCYLLPRLLIPDWSPGLYNPHPSKQCLLLFQAKLLNDARQC